MNCENKLYGAKDGFPHLCFVMDEARMPDFFPLLQKGVTVKVYTGCSVMRFLREQMGLSPEAIEKIQSIFLDGSAVDDLDSAVIRDGSSLALSAAMPGLVGATLRRGGVYSSFRSTVTYRETGGECISGEGFIQLKLFNVLMAELGPDLLAKGVFVRSSDLTDLLAGKPGDFWGACMKVILDGKPVSIGSFNAAAWIPHSDRIFLSVTEQSR